MRTENILKTELFGNHDNHVIYLTEFSSSANKKWQVIVAFLNSSGVVWPENIWYVFRVKPPPSNLVWTHGHRFCKNTVSLFWYTNMAAVTSCESVLKTRDESVTWRKRMRGMSLYNQWPFVCFVSACKWRHYSIPVVQLPTSKHKRNKLISCHLRHVLRPQESSWAR